MVAWGVFQTGAFCASPMLAYFIVGFNYRIFFPSSFRNVREIIIYIAAICMFLNGFFSVETYHCIWELNKQPFVTSRSHMDVVNTALLDAGWKYPVHAFVNSHVNSMNMIWAFLGLSI